MRIRCRRILGRNGDLLVGSGDDSLLIWFTFDKIQTNADGSRYIRNKAQSNPKGLAHSGRNVGLSGDGQIGMPMPIGGSITYFDLDTKKHRQTLDDVWLNESSQAWVDENSNNWRAK